mmetsp:Transcript_36775/g.42292  ORF Transcript_36775/g.42292 Transcript_36775/m.42292 type:complete len:91 (+) Transcript_36775:767-1039(+)
MSSVHSPMLMNVRDSSNTIKYALKVKKKWILRNSLRTASFEQQRFKMNLMTSNIKCTRSANITMSKIPVMFKIVLPEFIPAFLRAELGWL